MMVGVVAGQKRRASGGASDPYFASVGLLLHMDGTFVDKSPLAQAISPAGSAAINSTVFRFGTGSLSTPTSADYLPVPHNAAFNFGAGEFTVEDSVRFSATPSTSGEYLVSKWAGNGSGDEWTLYALGNALAFSFRSTGGGDFRTVSGAVTWVINQWHDIAVKRFGNLFSLWVDGAMIASETLAYTLNATSTPVTVGRLSGSPAYGSIALQDEVRITKGVARAIAALTAPFPNS